MSLTRTETQEARRQLTAGLTLKNWFDRVHKLQDVYAELDEWDRSKVCGWIVENRKIPFVVSHPAGYFWNSTHTPPEGRIKESFVFRIDRINSATTTRRLCQQLTGFLTAWEDGGRPSGPDKKPLIDLLLRELTYRNWFSTLIAIAKFSRDRYTREACIWLQYQNKRPAMFHTSQFGWLSGSGSGWEGNHCLPVDVVRAIDLVNGYGTTKTIRPQLTAFIKCWKWGYLPC